MMAAATVAVLAYLLLRPIPQSSFLEGAASAGPPGPGALQFVAEPIGRPIEGNPVITHVAIADLDQDGLSDVLVCDAVAQTISWIRQSPRGTFVEHTVGEPIAGPAHVAVGDVNQDGRLDLLVAGMGIVLPNNDRIGKVVVIENLGEGRFRNHVIVENVARVTDVRSADVNGDGRPDLIVGAFGYNEGEIYWLENLGSWKFRPHPVLEVPGTIMLPVADVDGDGAPDFAAIVSQEAQAVHLLRNSGSGEFSDTIIWKAPNQGWGCSGLETTDLNRDGRPDFVCSNGDGFNVGFTEPSPWHGLQWLENLGEGRFAYHRIGDMPGCYSPVCVDLDEDGDTDIVAVSGFNHVTDPAAVWMTAWLNDGTQHFHPVALAHDPTRLITVAAGDLDGNGKPVLVTGGFHAYPPFSHMSRVTLWRRK